MKWVAPKGAKSEIWWAWYREYLNSPEWRAKRQQVLDRDGHRCQKCGVGGVLQCHHLTYLRVGREELTDLQALCFDCHETHHPNAGDAPPSRPKMAPRDSAAPCRGLTKKGQPCPINAHENYDGVPYCHIHHPMMTYRQQIAARKEARRVKRSQEPRKPRKKRQCKHCGFANGKKYHRTICKKFGLA